MWLIGIDYYYLANRSWSTGYKKRISKIEKINIRGQSTTKKSEPPEESNP